MSEPDIRKLPPDALDLFNDPRLQDLTDPPPNVAPDERLLTPLNPPAVGESPFLLMRQVSGERSGDVAWLNQPEDQAFADQGNGRGFWLFHDRPRFEENIAKPAKSAEFWSYLSWFVAAPRMIEILSRFDPSAIDTVEIDWRYADGQKLDGYAFLDVRRRIHAYDYKRTAVVIARSRGRTYIDRLAHPRALHPIQDPGVHVFRDAYHRGDIFVSRALAKELSNAGIRGISFQDPARIGTVKFD